MAMVGRTDSPNSSGSPDSSGESGCAAVLVNQVVPMPSRPAALIGMLRGVVVRRQSSEQRGPDEHDEGGVADDEHRSDEEEVPEPSGDEERCLKDPALADTTPTAIATGAMHTKGAWS